MIRNAYHTAHDLHPMRKVYRKILTHIFDHRYHNLNIIITVTVVYNAKVGQHTHASSNQCIRAQNINDREYATKNVIDCTKKYKKFRESTERHDCCMMSIAYMLGLYSRSVDKTKLV